MLGERWKAHFVLSVLFFSKIDSSFSLIGVAAVFTLQFNSNRRAEIGKSISGFAKEELDI